MFQTIDAKRVRQETNGGSPVIVDVLAQDSYAKKHVPGAINVPVESSDFEQRIQQAVPDKDARIIVYCAGLSCQASTDAARRMTELGYRDVADFKAGLEGWRQAGEPFAGAGDTPVRIRADVSMETQAEA
jgi:rhodanese-related sulfurtransferase